VVIDRGRMRFGPSTSAPAAVGADAQLVAG
jgi:hypothetical protein